VLIATKTPMDRPLTGSIAIPAPSSARDPFQQQALLRVDRHRLGGRDVEEGGVESVGKRGSQKTAGPALAVSWKVERGVPTIRWKMIEA
jgi:hypothetical protein